MTRSFDLFVESPVTVEQIHSTFGDEHYWLARLAAFGDIGELGSLTTDADGTVAVTVTQDLRHDLLPGLVADLYPGDLKLVHTETWSSVGGGGVHGEIRIGACGAPASGIGVAFLAPARRGSSLTFTVVVEVKLPLLGGKIENYLGGHLIEIIAETHRFTTAWVEAKT